MLLDLVLQQDDALGRARAERVEVGGETVGLLDPEHRALRLAEEVRILRVEVRLRELREARQVPDVVITLARALPAELHQRAALHRIAVAEVAVVAVAAPVLAPFVPRGAALTVTVHHMSVQARAVHEHALLAAVPVRTLSARKRIGVVDHLATRGVPAARLLGGDERRGVHVLDVARPLAVPVAHAVRERLLADRVRRVGDLALAARERIEVRRLRERDDIVLRPLGERLLQELLRAPHLALARLERHLAVLRREVLAGDARIEVPPEARIPVPAHEETVRHEPLLKRELRIRRPVPDARRMIHVVRMDVAHEELHVLETLGIGRALDGREAVHVRDVAARRVAVRGRLDRQLDRQHLHGELHGDRAPVRQEVERALVKPRLRVLRHMHRRHHLLVAAGLADGERLDHLRVLERDIGVPAEVVLADVRDVGVDRALRIVEPEVVAHLLPVDVDERIVVHQEVGTEHAQSAVIVVGDPRAARTVPALHQLEVNRKRRDDARLALERRNLDALHVQRLQGHHHERSVLVLVGTREDAHLVRKDAEVGNIIRQNRILRERRNDERRRTVG